MILDRISHKNNNPNITSNQRGVLIRKKNQYKKIKSLHKKSNKNKDNYIVYSLFIKKII